jgi:transposase
MSPENRLTRRKLALDAIASGSTHKQAAELAGVARRTVSNWAWEDGVLVSPHASEEDKALAIEMLQTGHSRKYVANQLGYNVTTIGKWSKARGNVANKPLLAAKSRVMGLDDDTFRQLVTSELKRRGLEAP